jgi:hypothetical protein
MVLVNTKPGSVDADVHAVPTVHLDEQSGAQVKAYLAASPGDAVATLLPGVTSHPTVPTVARFSGRGPDPAVGGDVLKPDLTAPGVGVVTAVAPSADRTQLWDVETGSSIATPAVAGVAAVIHGARPAWSPATIQSALMTSARPLAVDHGPMSRGAGQLDAAGVLAPGLVYDAGLSQWGRLLREQGIRVWGYGTGASRLSAVQVNAPAISVGDLVGPLTVTRTVTNVGTTTATYTADISGLRGIGRAISPSSLTLAPGRSADFHVTFAATRLARYGSFTTGTLTWRTGSGAAVSTPVAVRPQLAAPTTEVTGHGRSGTVIVGGRAGVTGTLHLVASGLVGATPVSLDLRPGPFDPSSPATSAATAAETLHVARGARAARFQVISRQPADDLDIYVYLGPRLVASADGRSADETVTLTKPAPGRYRIYVTAHAAANDATAHGWFTSWVLPHADAGNLTLDRRFLPVVGGERFGVGVHWSGLDPRQRWWGYVACRGLPGVTYLTVN